jgi:Cu2+-exporting ATPase
VLDDRLSENRCLQIAAALESRSEHPIAIAFRLHAEENLPVVEKIENIPGRGMKGRIEGVDYYLGNEAFIREAAGISIPDSSAKSMTDGTRVLLASDDRVLAIFVLNDAIREEADTLIHSLHDSGIRTLLFSGDNASSVSAVAKRLGVDEYRASMLPNDKLDSLKSIQRKGGVVAMVGDGINDAPVLAGADVSIAMGTGAQYAAAAADMVLFRSDLTVLHQGIMLARKMMRVIRQNLTWALAYNITALPLAATGIIQPWMAALGMSASSLIVVANAMRLTK